MEFHPRQTEAKATAYKGKGRTYRKAYNERILSDTNKPSASFG